MTDKDLLTKLLAGYVWLRKRNSLRKNFNYGVYGGKGVLVGSVSDKQFGRIYPVLKMKSDKYLISIKQVRQQHGNSLAKKIYKSFKKKNDGNLSSKDKASIQI